MLELSFTPKRKSILWNYDKNGHAYIIALRSEKNQDLKEFFAGESMCNVDVKEEDGLGISLNKSGSMIWEKCDGITTVGEIVEDISKEYKIDEKMVLEDVAEFIEKADKLNIIDVNWRSIL